MRLEVCTIIKDEARYLEEWIEFHLLQGVSRFHLYDNGSTDDTKDRLTRYIGAGIVTLYDWSGDAMQRPMCKDYIDRHKGKDVWCAFIDIDEFLLYRNLEHRKGTLLQELQSYESYGGVCVNWRFMGSSGHVKAPDGFVLENFKRGDDTPDKHVKTILNMRYAVAPGNDVHSFQSIRPVVDQARNVQPTHYALSATPMFGSIHLLHYHVKSKEEYLFKCSRNRADIPHKKDFKTNFPVHDINKVNVHVVLKLGTISARIKEIMEFYKR